MPIERMPESEKAIEFLENSDHLNMALSKYIDFEKGIISKEEFVNWINSQEGFEEEDKMSFNCHSFLLSVMKKDFGIEKIETFEDVAIDKRRWLDVNGNMDDELEAMYLEHIAEEFPDASEQRMKKMKTFQENFLKASDKVCISDLIKENGVEKFIELVIKECRSVKHSRFVLVMDNAVEEKFNDTHSFIVLGPSSASNDLVILEKEEPGGSVNILKLTELMQRLSFNLDKGTTLNFSKESALKFYP
jgi:hypothetical protein